jgi:fumarate hydratase subunit beta
MNRGLLIQTPLSGESSSSLSAGQRAFISGTVYTARDAAHKRLVETLQAGLKPPFPLEGQVIYYVGPTPPMPGRPIGSAGPTTSSRMDAYAPALLDAGIKGMIGKGQRSQEVVEAIRRNQAVYFAAFGGLGALLSECIISSEVVAWKDLGAEAVRKLVVQDFPVVVAVDASGGDLYESGPRNFRALP